MASNITRRDFLKLCTLAAGSLAFRPYFTQSSDYPGKNIGRVAITSVSVYSQPNDKSRIICQRYRDELLNIYEEIESKDGPGYNPRWYRVWQGYVHSAHIQRVQTHLSIPLHSIPENKKVLAEVSVPFTQTMRHIRGPEYQPVYRLYYGSTHWIQGIDQGPDGQPWYRVMDELLRVEYLVPAIHLRPIPEEELAPISPDVPPEKKHIVVSLQDQVLTAYEGDKVVLHTKISSGMPSRGPSPNGIPTETPVGEFHIQNKMPSKHMGDGNLTDDLEAYELPGVPWTSFFELKDGVAFHGTYWHDNFGLTMSHGCVNMRTEEAKWLFRWVTPVYSLDGWDVRGYGTKVTIQ